jgi:hypothetical protein
MSVRVAKEAADFTVPVVMLNGETNERCKWSNLRGK